MSERVAEARGTAAPAAVLVPGLWHGAWSWDAVVAGLADRGIHSVAVDLPFTSLADDVATVEAAVTALARPVILVGHSYGGAVITGAGAHGDVRSLLYLAAYQLQEGESVSRVLPGEPIEQIGLSEALVLDEGSGQISIDPTLGPRLLYSDAEPGDALRAARRLRPVSRLLFRGVPDQIAWRSIPSTYVVCSADQVVHPSLQRAMARRATRQVDWDCGHSPALTKPAAVVEQVSEEIRRAQAADAGRRD